MGMQTDFPPKLFFPGSGLSLSLTNAGILLVPPGSITEAEVEITRVNFYPDWPLSSPYHQDLCLIFPFSSDATQGGAGSPVSHNVFPS